MGTIANTGSSIQYSYTQPNLNKQTHHVLMAFYKRPFVKCHKHVMHIIFAKPNVNYPLKLTDSSTSCITYAISAYQPKLKRDRA